MNITEKIELTEKNIATAIKDYWKYTTLGACDVRSRISNDFISTLARDSVEAKQQLRTMLRKSPNWNEELDAIVINSNTTHEPNYETIRNLISEILSPVTLKLYYEDKNMEKYEQITTATKLFYCPNASETEKQKYIEAINALAPRAYTEGKKMSRVFKALCVELGIADETANSKFQRNFAKLADEMSTRQIDFELFLSINPAHFITMSNPKEDSRGSCLTSCHSFNSNEYEYNNGCTGYARDGITMIAFTASDPKNPETLNNRKTTRQLFMYKPGSGVLLQSRMYNTSGGTVGAQAESKLYRSLVQKQIALCEDAANSWKTSNYTDNSRHINFYTDSNFGGYPDWEYDNYSPILSVRQDHLDQHNTSFFVGEAGLCLCCGEPTESGDGLFCNDCEEDEEHKFYCEHCGEYVSREESDQYEVHDENGNIITVCESCLENNYEKCEDCDNWYPNGYLNTVKNEYGDDVYVCDDCLYNNYTQCDECGEYYRTDTLQDACSDGHDVSICPDCAEDEYTLCEECDALIKNSDIISAIDKDGNEIKICENCAKEYETCECGWTCHPDAMVNGKCPECREGQEEGQEVA